MTDQPKTVQFTGYVVKQDNGNCVIEIPKPDQIELVSKKLIGVEVFVTVKELDPDTTLYRLNR